MLLLTLIGDTHHKYSSVYPYHLSSDISQYFKRSWGHQVTWYQFLHLYTYLVDTPEQAFSGSFNFIFYSLLVTLIVIIKLQIILFINWHCGLVKHIFIHSNNIYDMFYIIISNEINLELILLFRILASLYIVIIIEFILEWIYLSVTDLSKTSPVIQ